MERMIAGCPRCGARYRIDVARLRPEGLRLRCSKCEAVFRVTPPAASAPAERASVPAPQPPERPVETAAATAAPKALAPFTMPLSEAERRKLVLLADSDVAAGKALAHTLVQWGLEPLLVHDGVEAILMIQRTLPRAVILDAGLPKMFGFQVCELIKRNESLCSIQVVLVGVIHHTHRYRRPPREYYGADAYVERPQLPEALRPILRGFGLELRGAGPPPAAPEPPAPPVRPAAPSPPPSPPVVPAAPPAAPVQAPVVPAAPPPSTAAEPSLTAALADAERLARVIVSDVVLYNPEKFEAGIRDGNVLEVLDAEMAEASGHFQQRVDARIRESRDFLSEELVRVARTRGMK